MQSHQLSFPSTLEIPSKADLGGILLKNFHRPLRRLVGMRVSGRIKDENRPTYWGCSWVLKRADSVPTSKFRNLRILLHEWFLYQSFLSPRKQKNGSFMQFEKLSGERQGHNNPALENCSLFALCLIQEIYGFFIIIWGRLL